MLNIKELKLLIMSPAGEVQSIVMSMSVLLSVCSLKQLIAIHNNKLLFKLCICPH